MEGRRAEVLHEGKRVLANFHGVNTPTTAGSTSGVTLTGQESGRDACNLLRSLGRLGGGAQVACAERRVTFVYLLSPLGLLAHSGE